MKDLAINLRIDEGNGVDATIEGDCNMSRATVAVGTLIACLTRQKTAPQERYAAAKMLASAAGNYAALLGKMEAEAGGAIPGTEVYDMSNYRARPRKEIRQND